MTLQQKPVRDLLRWQGCLTVWLFGWAQEKRTAVSGWNLLDGSSDESAHESYHQDRDPDCTFHGVVSYARVGFSPEMRFTRTRIIGPLSSPFCRILVLNLSQVDARPEYTRPSHEITLL